MDGKLTNKRYNELLSTKEYDRLWEKINEDRSEVRKEVTDEILKDHFKVGEKVECEWKDGVWEKATIHPRVSDSTWYEAGCKIRRPPKTRPMTRKEKIHAIKGYLQTPTVEIWDRIDDGMLNSMLAHAQIKTEVTE